MILKPSKQNINKHHSGQRIYSKILEKKEMQKPHKLVSRRSLSVAASVSSGNNQQPRFLPREGLLAWCFMLCGHHLEILNIFTLDLGFCKWTRRGHLEHAPWLPGDPASSHLPAPCYFPQMGSSPPCWGQRSACVAGEGPRFSVALRRPGPLWGAETGGPAPAPGGPGRGQAGVIQSWLPASLLLLRITWQALLAHLQPGTSPLEVKVWSLQSLRSHPSAMGCRAGSWEGETCLSGCRPAGALHLHCVPGRTSHVAGPAH